MQRTRYEEGKKLKIMINSRSKRIIVQELPIGFLCIGKLPIMPGSGGAIFHLPLAKEIIRKC